MGGRMTSALRAQLRPRRGSFSEEHRAIGYRKLDHSMYTLPEKEQLEQYANAFFGLARMFQELPCQKQRLGDQELEQLVAELRSAVCSSCTEQKRCWRNDYFESCRTMYEILTELERSGEISDRLLIELGTRCDHPQIVEQSFRENYQRARLALMWDNRMRELRMAVGEQIFQTAQLLQRAVRGFAGAPQLEQKVARGLRRELGHLGIRLGTVRIFVREDGQQEVYLLLCADRGSCVSAKSIAQILSESCGEKMRPAWNCQAAVRAEPASFHFVPEPKYEIFCGISRITKAGELVSGDSYAFIEKDTGKVVMSLADGMGSGARASRESEKVIELIEQFLEAGFPQETAVRMINSCMLLQNSQQMFSTIDLCMVDLYSARCDLIKCGAASTFLLRGNEIEVLASSAFPGGVLQQSDYDSVRRQLRPGNFIIMMTDGVLEALPMENREQQMAELIGKTATRNAKEYARRLMEKVYLMQKLQARDDMTILVGGIWERD